MIYIQSDRHFVPYVYWVSLSQWLIRSPKRDDDSSSKNIDMIFQGVFYSELPEAFWGISVRDASDEEVTVLQHRVQSEIAPPYKCFTLEDHRSHLKYYLIASGIYVEENDLGIESTNLIGRVDKWLRENTLQ